MTSDSFESFGHPDGHLFRGTAALWYSRVVMPLKAGTRLGPYEIIAPIGAGGMGEVYRATDTKLRRDVAIKVLPGEMASDPARLRRFEQEARAASALNHPNIVTIYEIGEHEGTSYIAMEYVQGRTLRAMLSPGPLPGDQLVRYATQMAEGLAKAHHAGIVHRDLKPENIVISEDGYLKILDLGLAKLLALDDDDEGSAAATVDRDGTTPGTILGTVSYMSPEQAKGQPADFRSDQFSFGAVVYEMAVGRAAFRRDSAAETLSAVLRDDPPPLSEVRPDAPRSLLAVVSRCLSKQRDGRFASTAGLLEALRSAGGGVQETISTRSIAVLPFTNLSSDPEDEYFSDGLTDEIITDLSRLRDLQVTPSPSAFRFKGTDKSIREIATELNVRYILVGRLRKSGRNLRMTAQLVDAESDRALWADKYTADLEQVFEAQEQVSRAIARALKVELTGAARAPNAAAAEAYLKGRHFFRQATGDGLEKALDCFEQATKSDPDHAPAYSGIAVTLVWMASGWEAMPVREAMPRARAAAERALQLDPSLVEAHVAMGAVATYSDWDPHLAERSFQEALQLSPNDAGALYWSTHPLIWLDTRFEEALARVQRATQLSPVDPWIQVQHCWIHHFGRDFEAAIDRARHLVALEPLWGLGHYALGVCLATTGRLAEARASLHRGIDLDGRGVHHVAWLGATHALSGSDSEAQKCLAELESHEQRGSNVAAWKLVVHSCLGNADQVMQLLEEAFQERSVSLVFHLMHPVVDCVRENSRFVDLLHRMKLDHLVGYRPDPAWKPLPSWREL